MNCLCISLPIFPTALLKLVYRNVMNYSYFSVSILYVKIFSPSLLPVLCLFSLYRSWQFLCSQMNTLGVGGPCPAPNYKIISLHFISILSLFCLFMSRLVFHLDAPCPISSLSVCLLSRSYSRFVLGRMTHFCRAFPGNVLGWGILCSGFWKWDPSPYQPLVSPHW